MCPARGAARSGAPQMRDPGYKHSRIDEIGCEIAPVRICCLDQCQLPFAPPSLKNALACSRFEDGGVFFIVDELVHFVGFRETAGDSAFVFSNTAAEIVGHANVERALYRLARI
jgi:hypothetical protein